MTLRRFICGLLIRGHRLLRRMPLRDRESSLWSGMMSHQTPEGTALVFLMLRRSAWCIASRDLRSSRITITCHLTVPVQFWLTFQAELARPTLCCVRCNLLLCSLCQRRRARRYVRVRSWRGLDARCRPRWLARRTNRRSWKGYRNFGPVSRRNNEDSNLHAWYRASFNRYQRRGSSWMPRCAHA